MTPGDEAQVSKWDHNSMQDKSEWSSVMLGVNLRGRTKSHEVLLWVSFLRSYNTCRRANEAGIPSLYLLSSSSALCPGA